MTSHTTCKALRAYGDKLIITDQILHSLRIIQRYWRQAQFAYRYFGPEFFINSKAEVMHGAISFEGGDRSPTEEQSVEVAPWICLSELSSVSRIVRFMDKFWNLPKPEVLITITGSAQDFALPSQLQAAFDSGLVSAATSANAWCFSAGSDTGVMKLVGNAMHRYQVHLPVIGIFPWGTTLGRDVLKESAPGKCVYDCKSYQSSRDGGALNRYHTHFLLVDDGSVNRDAWGTEIALRVKLEAYVSQHKKVPIVQIVVQGGPGTLANVEKMAEAGNPIVLLIDSGGAATAIYRYCKQGLDAVDKKFHDKVAELDHIKQLNEDHEETLLTFFTLDVEFDPVAQYLAPDLSRAMLEAVMHVQPSRKTASIEAVAVRENRRSRRSAVSQVEPQTTGDRVVTDLHDSYNDQMQAKQAHHERALVLTVNWDQPILARKLLARLAADNPGIEVGHMPAIAIALQRALELQRTKIIKLFLKQSGMHHALSHVNMGRLYVLVDQHKFLQRHRWMQLDTWEEIMRTSSQSSMARSGEDSFKQRDYNYELYKKLISPFFQTADKTLVKIIGRNKHTKPHDIFFWLAVNGKTELARVVWPLCDCPVHMALLAGVLCKKIASTQREVSHKLFDVANVLENWAIGAIDVAREPRIAHRVLELGLANDDTCTALDIAVRAGAKPFLTQSHCISLMNAWWRGKGVTKHELSPEFSYAWAVIQVICPLFTPHCRGILRRCRHRRQSIDEDAISESGHGEGDEIQSKAGQDLSMMLMAMRIASQCAEEERSKASRYTNERVHHTFHKYSITHQINSEKTSIQEGESVQSFYQIPAIKFTVRFICHLVAITLYVVLIFETTYKLRLDLDAPQLPLLSKDGNLMEISWLVFSLGIWLDQQHQHTRLKKLDTDVRAFSGIWKVVEVMLLLIFICRLAMEAVCLEKWCEGCKTGELPDAIDLHSGHFYALGHDELPYMYHVGRWLYELYRIGISVNVIFMCILLFPFLSEYQPLGVIIIMGPQMIADISIFLLLFGVFSLGFCMTMVGFCFAGRYEAEGFMLADERNALGIGYDNSSVINNIQRENLFSANGALWVPLWAIFGVFEPARLDWLSSIIIWVYMLLGSVVLVNLLVAIFSNTFERIKKHSEIEYIYMKYNRIFEHRHILLSIPPVLNMPIVIFDLCSCFFQRAFRARVKRMTGGHADTSERVSDRLDVTGGLSHKGRVSRLRENLHDGWLLVEAYLKEVAHVEKDQLHTISRYMRTMLERAAMERDETTEMTKESFCRIEEKIQSIAVEDTKLLKDIVQRLDALDGKKR